MPASGSEVTRRKEGTAEADDPTTPRCLEVGSSQTHKDGSADESAATDARQGVKDSATGTDTFFEPCYAWQGELWLARMLYRQGCNARVGVGLAKEEQNVKEALHSKEGVVS